MNIISRNVYEDIKKEYLSKTSILSVIYRKYHKQHNINQHQFKQIIEKIHLEENIARKQIKKVRRNENPFSFHDKHPDSYPT